MREVIRKVFANDVYIKVARNRLFAKNLSTNGGWETLVPDKPFSTTRLLIGEFSIAEPAIKELLKKVRPPGIIKKSYRVVVHPLEMVEGGLSEIENRIFKELVLGSGAFKVVLHLGPELSDSEVAKLIASA